MTYNYWRKGGYSIGSEDYRWDVLKEKINPPLFFVFNVVFISLAQSVRISFDTRGAPSHITDACTQVLLFLITTPTYILLLAAKGNSFQTADVVFSRTLGALVFLAFYADGQQWSE